MRWRAVGPLAALAALWAGVACLDISSPVSGIAAISAVILPFPSVVVNDSLRDTSGAVSHLQVFAFAPNGDTLPASNIVVQFIANDSTNGLRVNATTGGAFGASLSGAASVLAQVSPVNGKGTLPTYLVSLPVVPKPDSASTAPDTTLRFLFNASATDSLSTQLLSPPLTVTVMGGPDTLIQKYVVEYHIDSMPTPAPGTTGPTLVLRGQGADSNVAVTNSAGQASLQLRVRVGATSTGLQNGAQIDTAIVRVRVRYQTGFIPISPSDSFVVVFSGFISK